MHKKVEVINVQIRELRTKDCRAYLELLQQLEEESSFLLYEPGERAQKLESQLEHWRRFLEDERKVVFLAEAEEKLIGYLLLAGNDLLRQGHVAQLVAGVLSTYQRKGVGSKLMQQGKQWSTTKDIRRLEVTVASQNTAAIGFYLHHDFVFEGIRKQSLLINGRWHNELYMSCQLGS